MKITFKQQMKIAEKSDNPKRKIPCAKCGRETSTYGGWIDTYLGGAYVHYECLSAERQADISKELQIWV